jgi:CHAT domain-containing protein
VAYNKDPADQRRGLSWHLFRGLESVSRDQLHALPGSVDEVRMVRGTLRDVKTVVLSGDEATEPNFKREASKEFDVVHLAVHAFADKDFPDRAALVFASDPKSGEDGLLQVREIRELPMRHTRLVTLSACDTSVGRIEGEEGVSSIVYAFLYAGARSAVASLWNIDDSITSELMKAFYAELERGKTEAAAMRTAQLKLLRRGGQSSAPLYWAAFDVMGDGSTTIRKVPSNDN